MKPTPRTPRPNPAARAEKAHRLSVRGLSSRAIAGELGVSPAAVQGYLKLGREQALASILSDAKQRLADRHAALNALLVETWANYDETKDLAALELVRRTEGDLRKLYGDDAPKKTATELSGKLEGEGRVKFLPREEMLAAVLATVAKLERQFA